MKRICYILFLFLIIGNLAVTVNVFKMYRFNIDCDLLLQMYYSGSMYAFKCGVIGVVVDWISRDWFKKGDK